MSKSKKKMKNYFSRSIALLVLLITLIVGYVAWKYIFLGNIKIQDGEFSYLYIPKETSYDDLKQILKEENFIKDIESFDWYARKMKLNENIHPGRYRISNEMSNRQLVKMILNGKEEKVKLIINQTTRNKEQLVEKLSTKFNMNENELETFLNNGSELNSKFGLNEKEIITLIRPGKYELSWSTSIEDFFKIMEIEYNKFWTNARKRLAEDLNYSQTEIIILASIVQSEAVIETEQKKIAGVYFNRLKKGIALQADPTVIFALNDFTIRRVLNYQLQYDSPYNTYKYKGLPPGPICFPKDQAISAVLNYEKSNNLFFCAKPELNGYSDFSETLAQHNKYAASYRLAMNKKGIIK